MSIQRPDAELTIDGRALSAAEAALESLRIDLSLGGSHDRFQCRLGLLSPFLDVEPGAEAEVKLGYGDDLEPVLAGTVSAVERAPWGLLVEGLAATAALSTTRVGRSYVGQSAADVVNDLVSSAGGTPGEVSASATLAAYHVDERRSAWTHVRELARLTGSELSAGGDGSLNFRPVKTGRADHTLRHGADLVAWDVGPAAAPARPSPSSRSAPRASRAPRSGTSSCASPRARRRAVRSSLRRRCATATQPKR